MLLGLTFSKLWACNGPSATIDAWLKKMMRSIASFVATKPIMSATIPLIIALVFATGIPLLRAETDYINLWYPTDTAQWKDLKFLWKHYGHANRTELVVASATDSGPYAKGKSNIGLLEPDALLSVLALQERIEALPLYGTVCSRAYLNPSDQSQAPCVTSTVLDLWGADRTTVQALTPSSVLDAVNQPILTTDYGLVLYRPSLIGDVVVGPDEVTVQAARALQLVFSVDRRASKAEQFENSFGKEVEAFNKEAKQLKLGIEFEYMTGKSFQSESQKSLDDDQVYVTFAMILMIVYVSVMLGRIHWVESKVLLSLSIIVTIIFSLVFAFGISGWLGWPLTQLSLMSIFILLGVGVDDMFIIVDSWNRHAVTAFPSETIACNPTAPEAAIVVGCGLKVELQRTRHEEISPPSSPQSESPLLSPLSTTLSAPQLLTERLVLTLEEVGGSILLTSLTDFVALMIGSTIAIPAISNFCRVAGLSVLAVFATQLTFFSAMLVLDQQRIQGSRMDVLFCFRVTSPAPTCETKTFSAPTCEIQKDRSGVEGAKNEPSSSTPAKPKKCKDWSLPHLVWDTRGWCSFHPQSQKMSNRDNVQRSAGLMQWRGEAASSPNAPSLVSPSSSPRQSPFIAPSRSQNRGASVDRRPVVVSEGSPRRTDALSPQSTANRTSTNSAQYAPRFPLEKRKFDDLKRRNAAAAQLSEGSTTHDVDAQGDNSLEDGEQDAESTSFSSDGSSKQGTALSKAAGALGRFILWPWRAALIVSLVLCVDVALGVSALFTVDTSSDWADFLPQGSPLLEFYDAREAAGFGEVGTLDLLTTNRHLDLALDDTIRGLKQMASEARSLDFVVGVDSWLESLEAWVVNPSGANSSVPFADFPNGDPIRRRLLKHWVEGSEDGARYAQWPAVVFEKGEEGDSGFLRTTRMVALTSGSFGNLEAQLKDMNRVRRTMKSRVNGVDAIAITLQYGWLAREEKMWHYVTDTILKTLCGVLVITLLFLEPWLSLATTLSVALVSVAVFGTMGPSFFDIPLNVSSFINLVLAIGFAVDYSAHVAEGYMVKTHELEEGSSEGKQRAQASVEEQDGTDASSLPCQEEGPRAVVRNLILMPPGAGQRSERAGSFRAVGSDSGGLHGAAEVKDDGEFLEKSIESLRLRMGGALAELGGSVLNGGLSTLLGVLVMSLSKSSAFQTLFKMAWLSLVSRMACSSCLA